MDVRDYLLSLPRVEECQPFGDGAVVYKVGGRMFAAYIFDRPECLPVKCDPDRATNLRARFAAITPAWHFNKVHWNDLHIDDLADDIVKREIRHSYLSVIRQNVTPKAVRKEILDAVIAAGIVDADDSSDR